MIAPYPNYNKLATVVMDTFQVGCLITSSESCAMFKASTQVCIQTGRRIMYKNQ